MGTLSLSIFLHAIIITNMVAVCCVQVQNSSRILRTLHLSATSLRLKEETRLMINLRNLILLACTVSFSLAAQSDEQPYSVPVEADYPKSVYWGDTHLHTRNSADAYSLGNMNLTPADAFRFAQGQELIAHNGMRVQLRRPLDFLVVSDHAEYLGGYYRFNVGDPLVSDTAAGRQWQGYLEEGDPTKLIGAFTASMSDP